MLACFILQELQDMVIDNVHPAPSATILLFSSRGVSPSKERLFPTDADRDSFLQILSGRLEAKGKLLSEFLQMPLAEFASLDDKTATLEAEEIALQKEINAMSVEYVSVTEQNAVNYANLISTMASEILPLAEKKADSLEATQDLVEARLKVMSATFDVETYNSWTVPALQLILSRLQSGIADLTASESRLRMEKT